MVKRGTKPGRDPHEDGITMHCRVDIFAPGYVAELKRALDMSGDDAPDDPSTEGEEHPQQAKRRRFLGFIPPDATDEELEEIVEDIKRAAGDSETEN
jgi:hypothetical protein